MESIPWLLSRSRIEGRLGLCSARQRMPRDRCGETTLACERGVHNSHSRDHGTTKGQR
jgi:hypothetical protein